jgi:hypothetical protein
MIQNGRHKHWFTVTLSEISTECLRKTGRRGPWSTINQSKSFRLSVNFGFVVVQRVSKLLRCIDTDGIGFDLKTLLLRRITPRIHERTARYFCDTFGSSPQKIEMNNDRCICEPAFPMRKRWFRSVVKHMRYLKYIASLSRVVFDRIPTHLRSLECEISERISVQSPNVPFSRKAGLRSLQ